MSDLKKQKEEQIAYASTQQRLASDPKVSVWVEASAGTGKTKVLSDRVLRLLLNGVNPARILCLTYTKAAAVEMNNRIAERLGAWAVLTDQDLHNELEKLLGFKLDTYTKAEELTSQARRLFALLLDTPGGIKIQTIHSFCQEILKRFPLEAKISPYFEVMDERSSKEAIESIKRDILRGKINSDTTQALAFLTVAANEFKFPAIMQSIADQRNQFETYLQKHQSVDAMIDEAARILSVKSSDTLSETEQNFWQALPLSAIKILFAALEAGTETSKKKASELAAAIEQQNFSAYSKVFLTDGRARKDLLVKKSIEQFPTVEKIVADETLRLIETDRRLRAIGLLNSTRAVLVLASDLLHRYQQYKKLHSKMDYNDLIMLTKNLLETPKVAEWILFKLDGGIDNVLIDEAQDTSPEQWAIIKALTKEFFSGQGVKTNQPTVFVVGDRKQSIYSFQGADPHEFEKMRQYFAAQPGGFRNVNMEVSFRSTAAVLDVVNTVFAYEKARSGVVAQSQNIAHRPARIGDGGRVELWPLIETDPNDNNDKIWLPPVERVAAISSSARLAAQIAETIKSKVSQGEILKSKGRPLKYRDFLILVQRRNSFVEEMVRACKNAGVNITGVDKIKLLEQIAVIDLLALAKFTLLPQDDLNLACVLKSPLFGLNDDDLFALCYDRATTSLWQRLNDNPTYASTASQLQELYHLGTTVRPFEFFAHVLNQLHGRQKFISRLGFDCEDALDEFVNLSLTFEQEHIPSMQLFIDWMQKDDVEIKRNLEQNDIDAVRLMTVHGSKGLQAPIVILPDTLRVKAIKQESGWLKTPEALLYPLSKENYEDTCCRLKEEEKALSLEEYHRLLYVALTRAEEYLCICGYKKKNKANEDSWYEICRAAIAPIAIKQPDEKLVYEVSQQLLPDTKPTTSIDIATPKLPSWLFQSPQKEPALARPLTPSHQDESGISALSPLTQTDNNRLYNRGRLIHKLLQFLPTTNIADRPALASEFLTLHGSDFSTAEKDKILTEVLSLTDDLQFAPLFGPNSLAEVALMGQVGDRIISGQIDRLVVTTTKVMIVDYKTNRPAAQTIDDVPQAYLKQMRAYHQLIAQIYPGKKVETYILWTNTAQIMKVG